MTEKELEEKFQRDIPHYKLWGEFVTEKITKKLRNKLEENYEQFLMIEPKPRVKSIKSLIEKAFYRNKNYKNPYEEITDKVGTRFVVLLVDYIGIVKDIVEQENEIWSCELDRDFEEERRKKPLIFEYQSVHYIVRNKAKISDNEIEIPLNTPCEIQIRTILQHAYAELTHDTTYKGRLISDPDVLRLVARSMALIETTDIIFQNVMSEKKKMEKKNEQLLDLLASIYREFNELRFQPRINEFILDAYRELLEDIKIEEIEKYYATFRKLTKQIKVKSNDNLLYSQPIILLLYFLIDKWEYKTKDLWPLTLNELRPLYLELGKSFEE